MNKILGKVINSCYYGIYIATVGFGMLLLGIKFGDNTNMVHCLIVLIGLIMLLGGCFCFSIYFWVEIYYSNKQFEHIDDSRL